MYLCDISTPGFTTPSTPQTTPAMTSSTPAQSTPSLTTDGQGRSRYYTMHTDGQTRI